MQEYIIVGKRLTILLPEIKIVVPPCNYKVKLTLNPDIVKYTMLCAKQN